MEKLELKYLAPYLPYGLKIMYNGRIVEIDAIGSDYVLTDESFQYNVSFQYVRPVLRPMSDLVKNISVNGVKITPIESMFLPCGERKILTSWAKENKCWLGTQISYLIYENLFELHFDVFGLIDKGLAISYSDVQSSLNEG
jgi:hypothetical protein